MNSFDDIKNTWEEGKSMESCSSGLDAETMEKYVKAGMNKVRNSTMKFFWGTFIYHMLIYALLIHVFIRFWGDGYLMLLSLGGILLYIPFTSLMMKKFKMMCRRDSGSNENIQQFLKYQHRLISEFFRFKRWFDWVGVPASALILVLIIFTLYVAGGFGGNLLAGTLSCVFVIAILAPFIHAENKKSFMVPLSKLESLIDDMDRIPES
jgi:hypothetical protein